MQPGIRGPWSSGCDHTGGRWAAGPPVAGKAALLVTGDAGVLALNSHESMPIVTTRSFWERLTGKTSGANEPEEAR